jgi:hypothetical protein
MFTRLLLIGALGAALSACSGGGSDDPAPPANAPPASTPTTVTVSGAVTFDFVPAVASSSNLRFGGLDYAATVPRPARGVTVELLQGQTVAASTTTDASGQYSFSAPASTEVSVRVRAEMLRVGAPSWDFRVVDNVNSNALYTLAGTAFDTGTAAVTRNLHAPSGWGGSSYTATRSAAPFAILDVVYDAVQLVLTAAPSTNFPALRLHWSTQNVPVSGTNPGEIGSSRYRTSEGIYLLGAANQDTDEYDRHVIAHEWGHYLEDRFSRSDSIGGPHTLTDQLDMRLAFGEAFGNAFAGMVTGKSVYVDTHSAGQARGFSFDLEQSPTRINPNPGWFNEESLQSLLWDIFDGGRDLPPGGTTTLDDLELGFQPIHAVLTGPQRTTRALTSIFPFVHALKTARPADRPLIDALTSSQRIAAIADEYGTGETNIGVPTKRTESQVRADFNSVYSSVTVGGGPVNVCSLDDYTSALTGAENKLASRRFVRFNVQSAGAHTITARAVAPLNAPADPDLRLHAGGQVFSSDAEPDPVACTVNLPQGCVETFTRQLSLGEHVLEVYEWTNTNEVDDPENPPIGRTCFNVTVNR